MASFSLNVICVALCVATAVSITPSPGCTRGPSHAVQESRSITVDDPNFGRSSRDYIIHTPRNPSTSVPMPLLLFFHGQYGSASGSSRNSKFITYGEQNNFITVWPDGKRDGNCGSGWNTGNLDPSIEGTCDNSASACCYDSCRSLGVCSGDRTRAGCRWATCYDDAAFTKDLVASLADEFCIDMDRIMASGQSNGGMLIHHLVQDLPGLFAGLAPVYALPLEGQGVLVDPANKDTSIIHIHGRSDRVIPWEGGWAQGWLYYSTKTVYAAWAEMKGCNAVPRRVSTPYDGGLLNLVCEEYENCDSGQVMTCLYDGGHGFPTWSTEVELTLWFLGLIDAQPSLEA